MKITKHDHWTNKDYTYDLPITQEQIERWQNGEVIQQVMPNLTADQREFLITGTPIGEFDNRFPDEEEEDDSDYMEKHQDEYETLEKIKDKDFLDDIDLHNNYYDNDSDFDIF